MDLEQRIAQFVNMAQADPDNEMAHFSLGSAYLQAGRYADAAESFLRCTSLNKGMSKAYQMAGEALAKAGGKDRAAEVLLEGFGVAARKGDLQPKKAIAALLEQLGRAVPRVEGAEATGVLVGAAGGFIDSKTGRPGTRLAGPPFRGPVGRWIFENISAETWNDWIGQGTKVINELRLDLSRDQDSETYERYMREYVGIDDDLHARLTGKP